VDCRGATALDVRLAGASAVTIYNGAGHDNATEQGKDVRAAAWCAFLSRPASSVADTVPGSVLPAHNEIGNIDSH
jgi:hypothetical protein